MAERIRAGRLFEGRETGPAADRQADESPRAVWVARLAVCLLELDLGMP